MGQGGNGETESLLGTFVQEVGAQMVRQEILPILERIKARNETVPPDLVQRLKMQMELCGRLTSLLLITQSMQDHPVLGSLMKEWSVKLDDLLAQVDKLKD